MGLPSWKRASRRSVKATQERSAGVSIVSAIRPYSEKGSSPDWTVSVSKSSPIPAAGRPLSTNGLSVSKVPMAASRASPPLGARGVRVAEVGEARAVLQVAVHRQPVSDRDGGALALGPAVRQSGRDEEQGLDGR